MKIPLLHFFFNSKEKKNIKFEKLLFYKLKLTQYEEVPRGKFGFYYFFNSII